LRDRVLPGFHIIAYNPSATIGRSDSATFNLEVSPLGGFTGAVTPSVSGVPAGVTSRFEPPDGPPHPGPMALTVTSDATAAAGTYPLTITGTSGPLSASTTVSLTIKLRSERNGDRAQAARSSSSGCCPIPRRLD
jgi:hypothetical protein